MNEEATALQAIYLNEVLMETGMDSCSRYLIITENIKDIDSTKQYGLPPESARTSSRDLANLLCTV